MLFHQPYNSVGNYSYNTNIWDNAEYKPHFHKNFELVYVISGEIHCTADDKSASLTAGDFALFLANEVHTLHSVGNSKCWIGVFSGDFVHAFEKQVKDKTGTGFVFRCEKSIENFLLLNLIKLERPPVYLLKACLYSVCNEYLQNIQLVERTGKNELLMRAIIDYIDQNYRNNISLSTMAERLGYNYHYLSKCFNKIFSVSFSDFLNSYRLDIALELLVETDKDISDIALESGFQSIRNFNSFFKSSTGTTPVKYRNEILSR